MKKLFSALVLGAFCMGSAAAADVAKGEALVKKYNCASCHGADYNKPIDPSYPKLAGQHADYLELAMIAYKRGGDVMNGRSNAIMGAQVKPLSRQEIKDLAAYLNSLPGSLVLRK